MQNYTRNRMVVLAAGLALVAGSTPALGVPVPTAAPAAVDAVVPMAEGDLVSFTSEHQFTMDDVIGNEYGATDWSPTNLSGDPNVIKDGDPGEDLEGEDLLVKDVNLKPINSTFGYTVQDFVGATVKDFEDGEAEEGYVNTFSDDTGDGLQFSDAETAVLKTQNLVGTWAAGLGGNEIKASTEHFTVMEAVLSCFQTVQYDYWASEDDYIDELPPVSAQRIDPNCVNNKLPNPVTNTTIADAIAALDPNEDSVIPSKVDLYLGTNYSVTEKDDGKVLYRWGQAVKRPNDIRFVAHLPLPEEWAAAEGKGFKVTKAQLMLKHAVTNNPNDQIRPEDWENEGATGVLPEYDVDASGKWVSTKKCYEGDGDFIPEGTVLKDPGAVFSGAPSSDLEGGFSNAWYTTIDRDPFAWSYADGPSQVPVDTMGDLISGPRWRMLSNKFGQDIPSLEIPAIPCDEPPYERGTVLHEVGDVVTTTINLLDWSKDADDARWDDAASPLAYSAGWMTTWSGRDTVPGQNVVLPEDADRCLSVNAEGHCVTALGTELTDAFDVAFYVKGDKKPLKVYDVQIELEYEGGTVTPLATLDFGDAPLSYGTEVGVTTGATFLGEAVDAEPEPAEPLDGTGDDTTDVADEDGVTLPATFAVGSTVNIPIESNGGAFDAWFDWNADGDFLDEGELVADVPQTPASIDVAVPEDAVSGPTYARFMVTGDTPEGAVGEIEDYPITIAGYDYGDRPTKYDEELYPPDPARHLLSSLSMKTVDAEDGPMPSALADGDDLSPVGGIDDEDGVNLSKFVIGKESTIRVTASEAGYLSAWIDWNADGDFADEGEMVIDSNVKDGTRAFKVPVPSTEATMTFARFRVSTSVDDMGPFGTVPDGEVEDHMIMISGKK